LISTEKSRWDKLQMQITYVKAMHDIRFRVQRSTCHSARQPAPWWDPVRSIVRARWPWSKRASGGKNLWSYYINVTSSNRVHLPGSLYSCLVRLGSYTYYVLCIFICGSSFFITWFPSWTASHRFLGDFHM